MASTARLGLKHISNDRTTGDPYAHVGMASTARLGLKHSCFSLTVLVIVQVGMASTARLGLKLSASSSGRLATSCRNGLYSPFGIETDQAP